MNRAGVLNVDVTFRQVARLWDLTDGRELLDQGGGPVPANQLTVTLDAGSLQRYGAPRWLDEDGRALPEGAPPRRFPGAYRIYRADGAAPFARTFVRQQARAISQRRVYVLGADVGAAGEPRLEYELAFQDGSFRCCSLREASAREPAGPTQTRLPLEWISLRAGGQVPRTYYAYLAPFPLPEPLFEALRAPAPTEAQLRLSRSILARSACIGDPFWTDRYAHGAPSSARPMRHDEPFAADSGLLVYLVDPFAEQIARRDAFLDVLTAFRSTQERLGCNEKYVLAKRVEALTHGSRDLHALVDGQLTPYLRDLERESGRLRLRAELRARDLVRWMGERQVVERGVVSPGPPPHDTWILERDGKGWAINIASAYERGHHAPYSDACADYHQASDPVFAQALTLVTRSLEGLGETFAGQQLLDRLVRDGPEGSWAGADAGTKAIFEGLRKGSNTSVEAVGGLLEHTAPAWRRRYVTRTAETVAEFLERKHGLNVQLLPTRDSRRALMARYRKEYRASGAGRTRVLALPPRGEQALAIANKPLTVLGAGLELVNLANSLGELKSSPDIWNALNAVGSTLDAVDGAFGVRDLFKAGEEALPSGGVRSLPVKPLAFVGSAIDTVLAARDFSQSQNTGALVGHGLRTVGSALAMGGAAAGETGVGVVVAVIGLGLQSTGSFVVSNFSDAAVFLRHCAWGDSDTLVDRAVNVLGPQTATWYERPLPLLRDDVPGQLRSLDAILYGFEIELDVDDTEDGGRTLTVRTQCPESVVLPPDARWTLALKIVQYVDGKGAHFTPDLGGAESVQLSAGDPVVLKTWAKAEVTGVVTVNGTITLDVAGDGRRRVTKAVEDGRFSFLLPAMLSKMR